MMSNNGTGRIRKPRRVVKPNGKQARQMLMGMALGCHVVSKMSDKIKFMIKTRLEAQVLLVLMAPFLAIPAAILAIPAACVCFSAMAIGCVTSNMTRLNALQHFMDRQQFHKLERQSTTRGFGRSSTTPVSGGRRGLTSSMSFTFGGMGSSGSSSCPSSFAALMNKPATARITRRTLPRRSHTIANSSVSCDRVRCKQ